MLGEVLCLRDQLSLVQLLTGTAIKQPLEVAMTLRGQIETGHQHIGCEWGKELLGNWAEFLSGKPQPRTDGQYPSIREERRNDVVYFVSEVPQQTVPTFPYSPGTNMHVLIYGDRGTGVKDYYVGPLTPALLPSRTMFALWRPEASDLLDSFWKDGILTLTCVYDSGTDSYWLTGHPKPNERQRAVVGDAFRGTASACPASRGN